MGKQSNQEPQQTITLTDDLIQTFRREVYAATEDNPRSLPWRETSDPYRIMVSEVMLQQTQVERVAARFPPFMVQFPDVTALAAAEFATVLAAWQGLGYNRRALALKRAAETVVDRFEGVLPGTRRELASLPGIGPYTAGAIMAFAFDLPEVFIETNIRTVFIHRFFPEGNAIHDREILPLVEATMDRSHPRQWYNALMDYGVVLKREQINPSRRSIHHQKQSPFAGSNRQLRSALLRTILDEAGISLGELEDRFPAAGATVSVNLARMEEEGLIRRTDTRYFIA
jgi:A/G-specific adenine glycosylase